MITYKDRAWCKTSVWGRCLNTKCDRNYTPAEAIENQHGVQLPLSIIDFKDDDCGYISGVPVKVVDA